MASSPSPAPRGITTDDLREFFTYHPPTPDQIPRYHEIREAGLLFAQTVLLNTPAGPDQSAAIRLIREAVWTSNASIALEKK